ncbi:helix-turn-helix domain-containing protein [Paludibacterium purpuratum]|uniref:Cro/C1-type helix-turn-helix DNA-binding protein n=1 Tax=Paludibacterium purpuratum TaxID=1144873 RepID=A0A4R7BCT3_9NEIS|nr:helix-turn-helix transcriptional regulator [Paludibacterium purpuratum]TDR81546.1 Cro/C1-type helix-turn-helix DNA-binding protein [Paludibacterium purpuratum]
MSQTHQLITTLKRLLKARGVTYAQVATHLKLSEASVKRQFSQQSFSLHTLEAICDLIQLELSELVQAAEDAQAGVSQLSEAQEAELVGDPCRVLVAVCVLNHWTLAQIVETYRLSEAECIIHLLQLDQLGLIKLMPENRVKLRIARDFAWRPGGPIHQFFRERAQTDFLNADFNQPGEFLRFQHAMLSPTANIRFQQRLHRLLQEFAELHEDDVVCPANIRHGTSLLLALRPWEPAVFESLRRTPDTRVFGDSET